MAFGANVVLGGRKFFAGRHAQLPFDEIGAGDRFRHRMLHLQARVHFHEPEAVCLQPFRGIGNELDGTGADVTDGLGRLHRRLAHRLAHRVGHARRCGFLDHLLMAALQRAIALKQMDDIAVTVPKHLHLNMPWAGDVFLDQHARIAEGRLAFALRAFQRGGEILCVIDAAHAFAAAAGHRLDENRIADLARFAGQMFRGLVVAQVARHHGDTGFCHERLGAILQSHRTDGAGGRADEDDPGSGAGFREFCVLGEEAIAGMDRFGAGLLGGGKNGVGAQIGLADGCGTDMHGFVRHRHMQRIGIGVGIDGDGAQAHAACGADNAAGDLTAISDQKRSEHCHILNTPNFVSPIGAFRHALSASDRTRRVSLGAMMPSSHSLAVA